MSTLQRSIAEMREAYVVSVEKAAPSAQTAQSPWVVSFTSRSEPWRRAGKGATREHRAHRMVTLAKARQEHTLAANR